MLTLTFRTDKPEAEIGFFQESEQLAYETWQAHRKLAETIHQKIEEVLRSQNKSLEDVEAIAVFKGPGSFTGLRIGITVANALAHSLGVPIVGAAGEDWQNTALKQLSQGKNQASVTPEYGSPAHITTQKR